MNVRDLFDGQALVPGALRGYRTWTGLSPTGRLISTGVNHAWRPKPFAGVSEHATCRGIPPGAHPAPQADCTCGLYAWYDPSDRRIPLGGCTGPVFGVVQATGRVVLGSHGFRAEQLEVVAVTAEPGPALADLRRLGYPVHDSAEAMLAAYPPEDVSALVQHQCDGRCVRRAAHPPLHVSYGGANLSQFVAAIQAGTSAIQHVVAAIKSEADRIAAEATEDERRRREADPRTYALEQRKHRATGPSAPSLFRAALRRRA